MSAAIEGLVRTRLKVFVALVVATHSAASVASGQPLTFMSPPGIALPVNQLRIVRGADSLTQLTEARLTRGSESLVRIIVSNRYSTADDLTQLQDLLSFLPAESATLRRGETVSALIARRYGFGLRDRPLHYRFIERYIVAANQLVTASAARPGSLRVPALPPLGFRRNGSFGQSVRQSHLDVRVSELAFGNDRGIAMSDLAPSGPFVRPRENPAATVLDVSVPTFYLRRFIEADRSRAISLLTTRGSTMLSFPLLAESSPIVTRVISTSLPAVRVQPSVSDRYMAVSGVAEKAPAARPTPPPQAAAPAGSGFISPQDASTIKEMLKAGKRNATLYVVDTSWPSKESFAESRSALDALFRACRAAKGLDAAPASFIRPQTGFVEPPFGGNNHAVQILASLAPLLSLTDRVRVVFVPLLRGQESDDILMEILTLNNVLHKLTVRPLAKFDSGQKRDALRDAAREATESLRGMPTTMSSASQYDVNQALVHGMYSIAAAVADQSSRLKDSTDASVFFMNASWTSPTGVMLPDFGSTPRGMILAASGEQIPPVDAEPANLALASYGSTMKQVITVVTLEKEGDELLGCNSNYINRKNAVGFSGWVAGNCGNSFAAPRIAWFLAARETLNSDLIPSGADWLDAVRARIFTPPVTKGWRIFKPLEYLNSSQ